MCYPIIAPSRGSHGLCARRARRTKSSRPEGPKAGPKGHKLEVGARRAPRLLVRYIFKINKGSRQEKNGLFTVRLTTSLREVVEKNGIFTVRLTVRVDPPPPLTVRVLWFFLNKLTYFDLFYHFIMEKIGPKFSHLLTVRAEKADPLIGWSSVNVFIAFKIFLENITHCTKGRVQKKKTVKKRSGWPLWGGRGGHPPSAWPLLFVKILTHFCPL